MNIEGFALGGYRSFGAVQKIGPLGKVNLFIGQNNTGKSNILTFLATHFCEATKSMRGRSVSRFGELDRHLGSSHPYCFGLGVEDDGAIMQEALKRAEEKGLLVQKILRSNTMLSDSKMAWFIMSSPTQGEPLSLPNDFVQSLRDEGIMEHQQWQQLWTKLTQRGRGHIVEHWIPETISSLLPTQHFDNLKVDLVPAIRRVGEPESKPDDHSGLGIIQRLAQLQNPEQNNRGLRQSFEDINDFLRNVTGSDDATLEIPYSRQTILVHMGRKTLPLSSLGTGVHEVVILASAATILKDQVLCVEEPELHMHPLLQRKLLRYLQEKTSNQYFISSHSAHLIDAPDVVVFRTQMVDGETVVSRAITPTERFEIACELGYRASDIVQANCVIWVEGPSDRIYINHWIQFVSPDLIEGIHYSIMFYGGRLLSHLSCDDEQVTEFISLRCLNRNLVVVIDSDKNKPTTRLNETKKRVIEEFTTNSGFAWLTKGREIENYISTSLMDRALQELCPGASLRSTDAVYGARDECFSGNPAQEKKLDKLKLARWVASQEADLSPLDLREKIANLVKFIENANKGA